jgi:hypothetical protein
MTFQLRPAGSSGPMYAPDRDLAHCGLPLLQAALDWLDSEPPPAWHQRLRTLAGVSDEDCGHAAVLLADAFNRFARPETPKFMDALAEAVAARHPGGPAAWDPTALAFVFMLYGWEVAGATYRARREAHQVGSEPPTDLAAFRAEADALLARLLAPARKRTAVGPWARLWARLRERLRGLFPRTEKPHAP